MTDDLRYAPPQQTYDWLTELHPASCLVVGKVADPERDRVSALGKEVRSTAGKSSGAKVRRGAYAFLRDGSWHALLVTTGTEPGPAESARRKYTEDRSHLVYAELMHDLLWEDAQPFAGGAAFAFGDLVRVRGSGDSVGRVKDVLPLAGGFQYQVELRDGTKRYNEGALLLVEGDPQDPEFWLDQPPAGADGLSLTLTWTKLSHPLTDTIYSFASSKTVFRAYQFKPVLKVLTGSSGRMLIADEVGLGKTIEAGLVWSELEQRNRLDRVLVVAPAVLTHKWRQEMRRRFDRQLDVLKAQDLAVFAEKLADGDEPALHGVISLESLRGASVLTRLAELSPRFDLVIVDEAHYLRNRESKSHALGQHLASWADFLIFLSATPLNLGTNDLYNLMSLLDEGAFGDQAVFLAQLEPNQILNGVARALAGEGREVPRKLLARLDDLRALEFGSTVTDRPDYRLLRKLFDTNQPLDHETVARARRLLADLNVLGGVLTRTRKADVPDDKAVREPRNIHVTWTEREQNYYQGIYAWYMARALALGTPPGFAMQMPLRQAASCIPASQQLLRERNPELFWDDFDDGEKEDEKAAPGDLTGLPRLTVPLGVDSKYDELLAELRKVRRAGLRQMMIFSFFRRTLRYLADRLGAHFTVRVMDGAVPMDEREQIMRDFRAGTFEILLLSEVGAEGLDFEFCNVLVNYDLPWNPMRVEQRIGRLDRFGQQHEKIFIYNMQVPGTIETDIFQRLYDRIGVFENSIGELEPILRDQLEEINKRVLDPKLDHAGRCREADRVAVAMRQRAHDTDELQAAQAHLSGLDNLLIEGFTNSGPGNGRFIGPTELLRMLDELFARLGGRRRRPDPNGIFSIVGSAQLAERLRRSRLADGGSRSTTSKLATMLQNETPIECTVRPETASRYDVELISGRHPLVKLALAVLREEGLYLPRFGSVSVPGLAAGRRYLVTVDLAETTGLRPLLELWPTAVDLATSQVEEGIGDELLTALAEGKLRDGSPDVPGDLRAMWRVAQQHVFVRAQQTERTRAQENAALVEGRILARKSSFDLQIRKCQERIEQARNPNILRMHHGHLRNLRTRRQEARDDLLGRKELTISLTAIAVVLASSAEPTPSRGTRGSAR
ncbi:helicase-related protein [Plantactinospora sp. B6F1]|uniref:DEAD/DEAH box helicase n=1 Tax=Plantactinospora sp. B6F1 TaxID=3158971 RepID=UPI0032D93F5C